MNSSQSAEFSNIDVVQLAAADGHQFELFVADTDANCTDSNYQDAGSKAPVLLLLPAMGVPARTYRPLLAALSKAGMRAAVMEWRGIGSSNLRASYSVDFGFNTLINLDIRASLDWIKKRFNQQSVYLCGHSLGGQLSFLSAAKFKDEVAGIITVASGSPWYKNWRGWHRYGLFFSSALMRLSSLLLGYFPGKVVKFAGSESRGVMRDWRYAVHHGRYLPHGESFDYEEAMRRMQQQALMITIDHDWLAPPESSHRLGEKLEAGQVTQRHLRVDVFESEFVNHFLWIKDPAPVVKEIAHWLQKQAK